MPDELDELISVLRSISIFRYVNLIGAPLAISINSSLICSPNSEEALSLLSLPLPPSKESIELATDKFLEIGVGRNKTGWVIIRCGALGAYMKTEMKKGMWVQAYWTAQDDDKIVDVTGGSFKALSAYANIKTGAGNSFLGGLAAGMIISGDMYQGWRSLAPVIGRRNSLNFLRLVSRVVCNRLGIFYHRTGRSACCDLYTD